MGYIKYTNNSQDKNKKNKCLIHLNNRILFIQNKQATGNN